MCDRLRTVGKPEQDCSNAPAKHCKNVPACPKNADVTFADEAGSVCGDHSTLAHATKDEPLPEHGMSQANEDGKGAGCHEEPVHLLGVPVASGFCMRLRAGALPTYRYFAAVMNWLNDSHHTMTVLYREGSTPCGTTTRKLSKVFTSPTRTMLSFRRLKSVSVSTNSGER